MEYEKEISVSDQISETEFTCEDIAKSVKHLRDEGYEFIQTLGTGGFGTVIEVVDQMRQSFAVKIIFQEHVNREEAEIWPTLKNENVLPLNEMQYIESAGTFAFFMPLIPTDLSLILKYPIFSEDRNGFDLAKSYLQDVARGLNYLHGRKLCHLDIKPSNVLLSYSGEALLCDFSSLTLTKAGTDSFVSPFFYRPAEAVIFKNGTRAIVNGFSYDIYTLGLLALEMCTGQAVLKSCQSIENEGNWSDQMYPRIFKILEKKAFENAVKKTFFMSKVDKKLTKIMRNFVKGCLCLNPRLRPSVNDVLEHKIFGGSKLFSACKNDIWEKKATSEKLRFLISLFVAQATSLSLETDPPNSSETDVGDLEADQSLNDSGLDAGDELHVQHEEMKHAPESDCETMLTKRQMLMKWISRKKLFVLSNFNRMTFVLRRSRK